MNPYKRIIKPLAIGHDDVVWVDVYAVLEAFGVTCPARAHAIKKLLAAGERGDKSTLQDLQEAIHSIQRSIALLPDAANGRAGAVDSAHVPETPAQRSDA